MTLRAAARRAPPRALLGLAAGLTALGAACPAAVDREPERAAELEARVAALEQQVADLGLVLVSLQARRIEEDLAGGPASTAGHDARDAASELGGQAALSAAERGSDPSLDAAARCTPRTGIIQLGEGLWSIRVGQLDAAFNARCLLQQLRVTPSYRGRRAIGLRLYEITPGSWPDQLGLENGDVLLAVNRQPVRSRDEALGLLHTLHDAVTLDVELTRLGRRLQHQYRLE